MFADYAFDRLIGKGYSPHAAAAIVGRFQQESGMDLDPLAVHDDGTGFGIAGWRDPEPGKGRRTNLFKWAKQHNLDPEDIDTQLDYFDYEVTEGEERSAGDLLRNAQTVDDAAAAMVHYERPEGYDKTDVTKASGYDNQLQYARDLLSSYTGSDPLAQEPYAGSDPLAQDTALPDMGDDEVEFESYTEEDDEDEESEDEEPTTRERLGQGLLTAGRQMQDQASEPLDYTPGGENVEIYESYDQGIPINQYSQFTSLYADGGVVGENDINEFFRMLGV